MYLLDPAVPSATVPIAVVGVDVMSSLTTYVNPVLPPLVLSILCAFNPIE